MSHEIKMNETIVCGCFSIAVLLKMLRRSKLCIGKERNSWDGQRSKWPISSPKKLKYRGHIFGTI